MTLARRPSLLFFGSGSFSKICFENLINHTDICASKISVVIPPGKSALLEFAQSRNLQTFTAPAKTMRGWLPDSKSWDFGVVASFAYFLPSALIDSFRVGCINAHPSLLPKYRGAAPIQRSMLDGATTGVSIIDVHRKHFDAGRIYYQEQVDVPNLSSYRDVEEILAERSGKALAKVLKDWDYFAQNAKEQEGQATLAPKIIRLDSELSFASDARVQILRKFLAIGHQEHLRARLGLRVVHFLDMSLDQCEDLQLSPGEFQYERGKPSGTLWIGCADGQCIGVKSFRVEGKSTTFDAGSFYNGFCKSSNHDKIKFS